MSENSAVEKKLKKLSDKDVQNIKDAQEMLGPDPDKMGLIKNLFWGKLREELVFPYPEIAADEVTRCDELLVELDAYFENEHPSMLVDRDQEIPERCIKRLFELGVMGMIVSQEYGGGGYSITSYNRVLERIGRSCGSTAVMVSAHQSIGCGALMLFGSEEQKKLYLPRVANDTLSAFLLSEPNVGCDAGGQETRCVLSEDGEYFILNGEKKWATSAAMSGMFTVMAKQAITNKKGKTRDKVTALICTPDMEGIDIFSRNRSKCGIRGTWQGRVRFTNVRVPKKNLLHKQGRGLNVALTCLNYGRCTLSAGMVGAGAAAYEQATKWAMTRYQFGRPIGDFELVQQKIATMAAYVYMMDAMLYMTTGVVDRGDEDIMLETAVCKVFCSELGFRTTDHALQIMGGEGYMTENTVERLWRDSRINMIVEGANEVMHNFVFGYGVKQMAEAMLEVKEHPFSHIFEGLQIASQLYLGVKPAAPEITELHTKLVPAGRRVEGWIQEYSHQVKMMIKVHEEQLLTKQIIQRRLSWICIWIHAALCSLSKLDMDLRAGLSGDQLEHDMAIVAHLMDLCEHEISVEMRGLYENPDDSVASAAAVAMKWVDSLENSKFAIPESTADEAALGTGISIESLQESIQQFGSGSMVKHEDIPGVEKVPAGV